MTRETARGLATGNVLQARERKTRLILPALIFVGSVVLLSYISVQTPISYDEAVYIVAGDFALYYPFGGRGGNFEHPTVGKMIIGFGLLATGHLVNEPVWHGWNPEAWQTSIPRDVLLSARLAPTALTSLTCVHLYVLASKRSLSRGVFAASLFLLNPLVLGNGYRALLDPILTLFLTLTWTTLLEDNKCTGPLNWKAIVLYGLGFATKYTAAIIFPAFLLYALLNAKRKGRNKLLMTVLTLPVSAYVFGCVFSPFGLGDLGFLRQDWHGGWLGYAHYFYVGQGRFFSLDSLKAEFAWTLSVVFVGVDYLALGETALFIAALLYLTIRRWRNIAEPELSSLIIFAISLLSLSLFSGKNAYYMILLAPWYAHLLSLPLESITQRLGQLPKEGDRHGRAKTNTEL